MPTDQTERTTNRQEIGSYLRDFGDDFRLEGAARVDMDDDVVSVNPPDDVDFEVRIEDESGPAGERRRLTFDLSWEKTQYDEELED